MNGAASPANWARKIAGPFIVFMAVILGTLAPAPPGSSARERRGVAGDRGGLGRPNGSDVEEAMRKTWAVTLSGVGASISNVY